MGPRLVVFHISVYTCYCVQDFNVQCLTQVVKGVMHLRMVLLFNSMELDRLEHPHASTRKNTKQTVVQAVWMKHQEELLIPQYRPDPVVSQQQILLEDAASSAYTSMSNINLKGQGWPHPVASLCPRALSVWSLPSANAATAAASTVAPACGMMPWTSMMNYLSNCKWIFEKLWQHWRDDSEITSSRKHTWRHCRHWRNSQNSNVLLPRRIQVS